MDARPVESTCVSRAPGSPLPPADGSCAPCCCCSPAGAAGACLASTPVAECFCPCCCGCPCCCCCCTGAPKNSSSSRFSAAACSSTWVGKAVGGCAAPAAPLLLPSLLLLLPLAGCTVNVPSSSWFISSSSKGAGWWWWLVCAWRHPACVKTTEGGASVDGRRRGGTPSRAPAPHQCSAGHPTPPPMPTSPWRWPGSSLRATPPAGRRARVPLRRPTRSACPGCSAAIEGRCYSGISAGQARATTCSTPLALAGAPGALVAPLPPPQHLLDTACVRPANRPRARTPPRQSDPATLRSCHALPRSACCTVQRRAAHPECQGGQRGVGG